MLASPASAGLIHIRVQSWTNFGPTLGTRSWTRISNKFQVVRGVLIQAHCPGYETRGSLQTPVFRGRPMLAAPGHIEMILAVKNVFGRSPKKI